MNLSIQDFIYKTNQPKSVIIDVRPEHLFKNGHILNSINMPDGNVAEKILKDRKLKGKTIYLVCQVNKSTQKVAQELKANEIPVFTLDGGINKWTEQNMPLVKK